MSKLGQNCNSGDDCTICQEPIRTLDTVWNQVSVLNCGHCYHTSCIDDWLTRSPTCPLDRIPVTTITQRTSYDSERIHLYLYEKIVPLVRRQTDLEHLIAPYVRKAKGQLAFVASRKLKAHAPKTIVQAERELRVVQSSLRKIPFDLLVQAKELARTEHLQPPPRVASPNWWIWVGSIASLLFYAIR